MGLAQVSQTTFAHPGSQEADDLRKRSRQERLHELRTGSRTDWVSLNRALPPVTAF